jgi:pimeloyl-ACP methyl ester carboxylesterase
MRARRRASVFAVKSDGARIAVETWGEGTPVYLVHGWAGRRGQLSALIDPLVARGHRVVAFDAPSHGDSSPGVRGPRSSSIPEFANALWAVVVRFGSPHAVIAHSMGATATAVALCDGLVAERVVMLAADGEPAFLRGPNSRGGSASARGHCADSSSELSGGSARRCSTSTFPN